MSDEHPGGIHVSLQPDGHPLIDFNGVTLDVPGPQWLRVTVGLVVIILSLYSFIWITEDAQRRGKSGCIALIFVFAATWPFSLLWWLWLRPPLLKTEAQPLFPPPPPPPSSPPSHP